MNCNCGESEVFCDNHLLLHTNGMQQPCPRTGWDRNDFLNELQLWGRLLHNRHLRHLYDLHNKDRGHLVNTLLQENRSGLLNRRNHRDLPLRHDRDVENLVGELQLRCGCATTGMSTTSKNWTWNTKDSTVSATQLECPALRRYAESEAPPTSRTTWTAGTQAE